MKFKVNQDHFSNGLQQVINDPLDIVLSQCEMYFRSAFGRYIGHTGPLFSLGSGSSNSDSHTLSNSVHSEK